MLVIILIIIFLLLIILRPCSTSFRTRSGRMYQSRNLETAEFIDCLRDIAIDLSYELNDEDKKLLQRRLQNTSFKELINEDPNILAWNYSKGMEIGIKIFDSNGNMYPCELIIESLLHELGHSLTYGWGHGVEWRTKDDNLQNSFKTKYVKVCKNKCLQSFKKS